MLKTSEHAEQVAVMQWAAYNRGKYPELEFLYAVPNGAKLPWRRNAKGQRYSAEAMRLKAEGLKNGVPDLCLPVKKNGCSGLYIEMKAGKNKTTPEQEKFIAFLKTQDYRVEVCYGFEDAKKTIEEYLKCN